MDIPHSVSPLHYSVRQVRDTRTGLFIHLSLADVNSQAFVYRQVFIFLRVCGKSWEENPERFPHDNFMFKLLEATWIFPYVEAPATLPQRCTISVLGTDSAPKLAGLVGESQTSDTLSQTNNVSDSNRRWYSKVSIKPPPQCRTHEHISHSPIYHKHVLPHKHIIHENTCFCTHKHTRL